jgi:hypothetical protein
METPATHVSTWAEMWVGVIQKSRERPSGQARGKRAARLAIFDSQQSWFLRSWRGRFLFIPVLVALLTAYPAVGIALAIWLLLVIGTPFTSGGVAIRSDVGSPRHPPVDQLYTFCWSSRLRLHAAARFPALAPARVFANH